MSFEAYYETEFLLHDKLGHSIETIENMLPFEVDIRLGIYDRHRQAEEKKMDETRQALQSSLGQIKI